MSEPQRPSEREHFDAIIDRSTEERSRYLDAHCADAPALRRRIEALLEAYDATERSEGFLDERVMRDLRIDEDDPESEGPLPRMLGPYRLLRVLGKGGMGVVFEAEQTQPRRNVAVKILRDDRVTHEIMRRFKREVDTLGRLQHRGIAQIYEAGRAIDGERGGAAVSYIAMELVEGVTLDAHVGGERRTDREIVGLLAQVSDAIHHAHERGVIHRDLKPANIMVVRSEGLFHTKILDFGVARLAQGDGAGDGSGEKATVATFHGLIVGTVAYMSPEQLSGDPASIDARTDVYALGAILYELLSGRLPLDVRNRPIADAARVVRDEEPTRLSSIDPRFRGDLETIVATALEKDRARRYPSAAALGDELRRFLADEPILARPPTGVERLARFARRNREIVAGALATFIVLLAGVIVATTLAVRATRARNNADWTAYCATISAASAAIANQDAEGARRHLADASPRLRDWEWRYLAASLDQSIAAVPVPAWGAASPAVDPGTQVAIWPLVARARNELPATWPTACAVPSVADESAPESGALLAWHDQARQVEIWTSQPSGEQDALIVRFRGRDGAVERQARLPIDAPPELWPWAVSINHELDRVCVLLRAGSGAPERVCVLRIDGGTGASLRVDNLRHGFLPIAMGRGALVALGGGPERTPILWNSETGAMTPIKGHVGDMTAIAFSHDGARVATGGNDRTIRLFDVDATMGVRQADVERHHQDSVLALRFAPDDSTLLSTSVDGTIRLWSTPVDRPGMSLLATLAGHRAKVHTAEFSADGAWVVSIGEDERIRAWSTDPAALTGSFAVPDNSSGIVDFAKTVPRCVAENIWSRIRCWDFGGRVPKETLLVDPASESEHGLRDLAISPDGATVAMVDVNLTAHLFSIIDGQARESGQTSFKVVAIGFTRDGRPLGLRAGDEPVAARLCWLPDGAAVGVPLPSCDSPYIESTGDGARLRVRDIPGVSAGREGDHQTVLLDARTGEIRGRHTTAAGDPSDFGTLPDGRQVLACVEAEGGAPDATQLIAIRDALSGELLQRIKGHAGQVFTIAFSPDGRRLVSGGRDRLVRVWDTSTWGEVVSLPGPTAYVWALRFSPDGTRLAISGGDRTYRLWATRDALP